MPPEFFELMGIEPLPEEGDYFVNLGEFARRFLGEAGDRAILDNIYDQQGTCSTKPWKAADHPVIAGWITKNEAALDLVVGPEGVGKDISQNSGIFPSRTDWAISSGENGKPTALLAWRGSASKRRASRGGQGRTLSLWTRLVNP